MQQRISRDIRDDISNRDLAAARRVLEAHFLEPIPERIGLLSAIEFDDRRTLDVGLDCAADQFEGDAKYILRLGSGSGEASWHLEQIVLFSQRSVPGQDEPVTVMGALSPDTVAALIEHVCRFWTTSGAGSMKITGISTNELPPLRSLPAYLDGTAPASIYAVGVQSLEPAKSRVLSESDSASFALATMADAALGIWLSKNDRGEFVTTDVYPTGFPADPERLKLLRDHLEQRRDEAAAKRRVAAAVAVLPQSFRSSEPLGTAMFLHGQMECFMMDFPEVQVRDRHRASGVATCVRLAGTHAAWRCHFQEMEAPGALLR